MAQTPPNLPFIPALAKICATVVNKQVFEDEFRPTLTGRRLADFIEAYRLLAEPDTYKLVESWCRNNPSSPWVNRASSLFLVLDWMAGAGLIPTELAKTRFVDRDEREFDDEGNEW